MTLYFIKDWLRAYSKIRLLISLTMLRSPIWKRNLKKVAGQAEGIGRHDMHGLEVGRKPTQPSEETMSSSELGDSVA